MLSAYVRQWGWAFMQLHFTCDLFLRMKHCQPSSNPHNFSSIFVEPVEGTKEAILSFLSEEKSKIKEMKANIIASFTQILCRYKIIFEEVLNEIDSDSTKISSYAGKIWQAQKLSRIEKDPALNLLALQPLEAVENLKKLLQKYQIIILGYSVK
ncbi:unnamed protein product [Blepharisma stoltei]|uniref:Exocyst complex component Sec8 n=1 Tax=Blepharisma stoltei TaxID=1481888 RepID=A0AAU9KAM8_9CILI|nr:unnamed protein product [Blepharisma stoltei]